jgi:hypothetical protein
MFISRKEKEYILISIKDLYSKNEKLGRSMNALHDDKSHEINEKKKEQIRRREYSKAYYNRKKAEKVNKAGVV